MRTAAGSYLLNIATFAAINVKTTNHQSIIPMTKNVFSLLVFCLSIFLSLHTWAQKPRTGKAESWVKSIQPDLEQKVSDDIESGTCYLVFDVQEHVEQQTTFNHYAYKIVNAEGVQNMSDISVSYDPSYQKTTFHYITLYRNGKPTDLLQSHSFETYRHETDKEAFMYDGRITNTMHLKDIREGDVIEYAYTLKGYNPAYKGKFVTFQNLNFSVPVYHEYFSVIVPTSRTLKVRYNKPEIPKAKESTTGNYKIYEWDIKSIKAVEMEYTIPGWYEPYQTISFSEYQSWAEVVQWALPFYALNDAQLAKIKNLYGEKIDATDDVSIVKAIRFVQDEVRYLGFEMGVGSYKPNSPDKVYNNRFGDCKDKSFLLTAILRSNGIDAYPMLVNTSYTFKLPEQLPSPNAFDHCVVYINLLGNDYYIDPTISYQGGSINNIAFPRYKYGLIIREGETELHKIRETETPTLYINEVYTILKIGGLVNYNVSTEYNGSRADDERAFFARNSNASVVKSFLSYYENQFPKIKSNGKVEIEDDARDSHNTITVKEKYTIEDGFWEKEASGSLKAIIFSMYINSILHSSGSSECKMPYYVGEPIRIIQKIEINFPEYWAPPFFDKTVSDPAFYYSISSVGDGQSITLNYEYEIRQEYVMPEDFPQFYEHQEEVENNIAYHMSENDRHGSANRPTEKNVFAIGLGFGFLVFILSIVVAILVFVFVDPKPKPALETYSTIGGGLVFIGIILCLTAILFFIGDIKAIGDLYDAPKDEKIGVTLLRLLNLFISIFLLVISLLLAVCFFLRRTNTKIIFLGMLIVWVISWIVTISLGVYEEKASILSTFWMLQILFTLIAWLPFFIISDRVRGTFTVRFKKEKSDLKI